MKTHVLPMDSFAVLPLCAKRCVALMLNMRRQTRFVELKTVDHVWREFGPE
jgi:hypothetical protein